MEREIIYTLNKEFVYAGTAGKEKVSPGTLLVARDKYSNGMHRFLISLSRIDVKGNYQPVIKIAHPAKLKEIVNMDLRNYPIVLLDMHIMLSEYDKIGYHVFMYMGKEVVSHRANNYHKPLFFVGHSYE